MLIEIAMFAGVNNEWSCACAVQPQSVHFIMLMFYCLFFIQTKTRYLCETCNLIGALLFICYLLYVSQCEYCAYYMMRSIRAVLLWRKMNMTSNKNGIDGLALYFIFMAICVRCRRYATVHDNAM